MFLHESLIRPSLMRVQRDGNRFYQEIGKPHLFRSVTNVIRHAGDHTSLDRWKTRVGAAEADRISSTARSKGNSLHDLCEKFLANDPNYKRSVMPDTLFSFNKIKALLVDSIQKVYGVEFPLNSNVLDAAGTADLICEWKTAPAIVDFKTSKRLKKEEWIYDYFLQATTYAVMANELFDLGIEDIVVLILVEHENPQIFEKKITPYIDRVYDIFTGGQYKRA